MSAEVILLCEDQRTDRFVRRFLSHRNFRARDIRTLQLPGQSQSGEQWVRQKYPEQLKAIRSRRKAVNAGRLFLFVVVDADRKSTQERQSQLDSECREQNVPSREADEPVIIIIPRRNIETWFAYLDGKDVDEGSDYKAEYRGRSCKPFADELHRMCHERQQLRLPAPPSLEEACREYQKLKRQ